jgi:large subunit ribosomal protein L4
MKVQAFTAKGIKKEERALPKEFGQKVELPLLAQALYVYEERSHIGLRKTKTRAEVERTSKKLYKQKGTGGARHGSKRAPIFVGGGVALGPRPIRRTLKLPSSVKSKARVFAFALKAEEKQLIFVSGLQRLGKTKEAAELLNILQKKTEAKRFTFVLSEKSREIVRILRNLPNANYLFYKDANALDIYRGGMIVLDDEVFKKEVKTK